MKIKEKLFACFFCFYFITHFNRFLSSFFLCRHYETDGKTLPEGGYADELKLVISSVDNIVDSLTITKSA